MKRKVVLNGVLVGGLLIAPLIALMYLVYRTIGLPFPPFDLFNWVSRLLPGPVITFGIDSMISLMLFLGLDVSASAKVAEQLMAVNLFFVLGLVGGGLFFAVVSLRQVKLDMFAGMLTMLLFGSPIIAISVAMGTTRLHLVWALLWLALVFVVWGWALGWAYRKLYAVSAIEPNEEAAEVQRLNRRQFLMVVGGAAATITVAGTGLAELLSRGEDGSLTGHDGVSPSGVSFPNANDPVVPVPGTRPEYTPLKDHYKVFIELEPTVIDGDTWHLPITGMVDNPLMLSIDQIRENYPKREQFVTLRCISGRVGTTLISTTLWSGASLQQVLADAGVKEGARYLIVTSGDGFHETIDLELVNNDERIMLCYDWDGNPLPVDHGFPLRVWIPDLYGMKQPKWITGIEVTDEYREGYWVERNWDEVAQVKTTSVIDVVAVNALIENGNQPLVPIGGRAYSGDRGISAVEVRVDGGEWQSAQLRSPLSETTWVIWRYEWPFEAGDHTFEVRCYEGDGLLQITEENDARPSGATGIQSVEEEL